ncbi:MAG TPA: hypothetical protein V6D03_07085 [Candidatus Caenarcaniphilales bacterium]
MAKHDFVLHRFRPSYPLGVYRWLVLALVAFSLALCGILMQPTDIGNWNNATEAIARLLPLHVVIYSLLKEL